MHTNYYILLALLLAGCKPSAPTAASPTPTPAPSGNTWHVAISGDDKYDGKTVATAFRSLPKAATVVEPGDTVLIGAGLYTNDVPGNESVVSLTKSGKPDAWITWKPEPGQIPVIKPTGWGGITISASYQIIDGLTVTGNNQSIVYKDAIADAEIDKPNPAFNSNGITVEGRRSAPDAKPHHVIVRHCTVSECPGGGVTGLETDYLTIEDNVIFNNCWFMRYGGSGITTLDNWTFDDKPGYHVVIQRNLVWNNRTNVQWKQIGQLSDGNGILLDVTDEEDNGATNPNADAVIKPKTAASPEQTKPERPKWNSRALIANNISAYNGGSGIHVFRTRHVDIINNTTYSNGHNVGYPELFSNRSVDINIFNNVIVPRPGGKITSNSRNTDVRWDYNIYPFKQELTTTPDHIVTGPHDIVADPLLVKIADDLRNADFHLQPGSPAIDSGTDQVPLKTDHAGQPRPVGKARDRGAYEQ